MEQVESGVFKIEALRPDRRWRSLLCALPIISGEDLAALLVKTSRNHIGLRAQGRKRFLGGVLVFETEGS